MSISIKDLLEAGAHFGHQTKRWNPKMRPYIYGARNGIYIIDLQKTAKMWVKAHQAIVNCVARGEKVLFVGTKAQAQEVVAEEALRAGQYFVNRRWLGGMLTNFKTIKSRIQRLEELTKLFAGTLETPINVTKKEAAGLMKDKQKLEKTLDGIRTMTRLPGLVVVIDPGKEHIAVSEAQKLNIPILAITDTNCNPDGIDYLVPANDDALKSIKLFMGAVADACMEGIKSYEKKMVEETQARAEQQEKAQAAKASPTKTEGAVVREIGSAEGVKLAAAPVLAAGIES